MGVRASARSGFSALPPVKTSIFARAGRWVDAGSSSRKRASSSRMSAATLVTIFDIEYRRTMVSGCMGSPASRSRLP